MLHSADVGNLLQVLYPCVTIQSKAELQAEEMDKNLPLPEAHIWAICWGLGLTAGMSAAGMGPWQG